MPGGDLILWFPLTAFWAHLFVLRWWFMLHELQVQSSPPLTHLCHVPLLLLETATSTNPSLKRLMQWLCWIRCRMGLVGNWVVCSAKPMMRVLFPLGTLSHKMK